MLRSVGVDRRTWLEVACPSILKLNRPSWRVRSRVLGNGDALPCDARGHVNAPLAGFAAGDDRRVEGPARQGRIRSEDVVVGYGQGGERICERM